MSDKSRRNRTNTWDRGTFGTAPGLKPLCPICRHARPCPLDREHQRCQEMIQAEIDAELFARKRAGKPSA